MSTVLTLAIFVMLLVLTAFFVSTEFAIVKVRQSRIDQLLEEGKKGSIAAKKVTSHLDEYLSACQLGITVTALGIGMVGERTFAFLLDPLFDALYIPLSYVQPLTIAGAFLISTFLHVVIGELAPKTIAIQRAEAITLAFSRPIQLFYKILYPFIWLLNGSARILVKIFGFESASEQELSHSEEELRMLMSESYKSGEINGNELKYVNNVFEFDDTIAREIMVPRTAIVGFEVNTPFMEVVKVITEERYTRYPIFEGDRDNMIGFLNIKDFLTQGMNQRVTIENFNIMKFLNPVIRTIESTPIHVLLQKMQRERTHIAILLDEYGGTSGMVTVEDILEELVGEIRDEFDDDEVPALRKIGEQHYIIYSKSLLADVNEWLHLDIELEGVDTIGGWYFTNDMDLDMNNKLYYEGYIFTIYEKEGHQLHYLEVKKGPKPLHAIVVQNKDE